MSVETNLVEERAAETNHVDDLSLDMWISTMLAQDFDGLWDVGHD